MNPKQPVSEELLGAFLDNQLDAEERIQVLEALRRDKELAARVCELRQDTELVALAYRDPPRAGARSAAMRGARVHRGALAAAALLAFGIAAGLILQASRTDPAGLPLRELAQLDPAAPGARKILVHLSSLDAGRTQAALDAVESVLSAGRSRGDALQVEVIANAEGLGLLREGTPYAGRIQSLARRYGNVSFLACGVAMENARLSENAEIKLISQARRVPAALEEILARLKDGWTYVRG